MESVMAAMVSVNSYTDFKSVVGTITVKDLTAVFWWNSPDQREVYVFVDWKTGTMIYFPHSIGTVATDVFNSDYPKAVHLLDTNPESSGPNQAYIAWTTVGAGQI
jgi:hypothetical protein